MARYPLRDRVALAAALAGPLIVALVLVPLRGALSGTNMALILVVVIVAVAVGGNRLAGALAALTAAAWFGLFLAKPYESFTIRKTSDAVLLLVVGLVVSQLAARTRRLEVITVTDAGYLSRIQDTAQLAQSATSGEAVVDYVKGQLTDLLQLRACRFEYGSLLGHPLRLGQDGGVAVGRRRWEVDQRGWPDEDVELLAFGNGRFQGRFMLTPTPGARPSLQARLVAVTLADQAGNALDSPGPDLRER